MSTRHGLLASLVLSGLGLACGDGSGGGAGIAGRGAAKAAAPAAASAANRPALPPPDVPSPDQSAGVFMGIGEFRYVQELAYTVNDAVDVAHALSVEHQLLPENHVRILLAGDPSGASEKRYGEMMADAHIIPTKANFLAALEQQASLVGPQGILYVFVASHGFSYQQDNYVMATDSDPRDRATAVSSQDILNATKEARGRIVLILDSCRVRVPAAGGAEVEPAGAAARSASRAPPAGWEIFQHLTSHSGYAVLFATRPTQGAGPDPSRLNGIFTGALLDGLSCRESSAQATPVSLFSLASFAQNETTKRTSRSLFPQSAELLTAQGFRDFLLLRCGPIGEIFEPKEHEVVDETGQVQLRVFQPGTFYARAVIYSLDNAVYYPQHPEDDKPAGPGDPVILPVDYGLSVNYLVYVGLGADRDSLPREIEISKLPEKDSRGRPIYWLGPVQVRARNPAELSRRNS